MMEDRAFGTGLEQQADDENILAIYLSEIGSIPVMTREETSALAVRAVAGDGAARNELIQGNLKFVVRVATRYQNLGLPLIDLIS